MDIDKAISFVEAMERAVSSGDVAEAGRYLAPDIAYTVGAAPVRHGIQAIINFAAEQGRFARWEGHSVRNVSSDGDALIVEVESRFTRLTDGRRIAFPCADIYRFRDGLIYDWRVYADMSPFGGA